MTCQCLNTDKQEMTSEPEAHPCVAALQHRLENEIKHTTDVLSAIQYMIMNVPTTSAGYVQMIL